jgi:hypothetical protein
VRLARRLFAGLGCPGMQNLVVRLGPWTTEWCSHPHAKDVDEMVLNRNGALERGSRCGRGKGRYEQPVPLRREAAAGQEAAIQVVEKTPLGEPRGRNARPGPRSAGEGETPVVGGVAAGFAPTRPSKAERGVWRRAVRRGLGALSHWWRGGGGVWGTWPGGGGASRPPLCPVLPPALCSGND